MSGASVLLVAACGGGESSDVASSPVQIEPEASTSSQQPLEPVLVSTARGGQLDFNSLRGQDVLLWFWAPW
ncbi:MAG: hypothetical protein WA964_15985 [Ilumatobacter sp.]|uniref:hypothetical protein n=1 Tax=Ilumatobacter sp. TaxID=1967498 RepID=UPI003C77BF5A